MIQKIIVVAFILGLGLASATVIFYFVRIHFDQANNLKGLVVYKPLQLDNLSSPLDFTLLHEDNDTAVLSGSFNIITRPVIGLQIDKKSKNIRFDVKAQNPPKMDGISTNYLDKQEVSYEKQVVQDGCSGFCPIKVKHSLKKGANIIFETMTINTTLKPLGFYGDTYYFIGETYNNDLKRNQVFWAKVTLQERL